MRSSPASCHFLPVLGPNILLGTLFSNTLSLCSYLSVRDEVSHAYKTTSKIICPGWYVAKFSWAAVLRFYWILLLIGMLLCCKTTILADFCLSGLCHVLEDFSSANVPTGKYYVALRCISSHWLSHYSNKKAWTKHAEGRKKVVNTRPDVRNRRLCMSVASASDGAPRLLSELLTVLRFVTRNSHRQSHKEGHQVENVSKSNIQLSI